MAQGMVTDYFSRKKRTDPFQPSKRRKVQRTNVDDKLMISVASLPNLKSTDAIVSVKQNSEELSSKTTGVVSTESVEGVVEAIKPKHKTTQKTRTSAANKRRTSTRSRTTRQKSVSHGPMDEVLARTASKNKASGRVPPPAAESEESKPGTPSSESSNNSEEVTSISDDHDAVLSRSLPGTPSKRSQQNSEAPIRRKRCKPSLSEAAETVDIGGEGSLTESKPELSSKTRQKKCVSNTRSSKSRASAKKSLDQTFQQYENKETTVTVKKEEDGDIGSVQDNQQVLVSNSKRTEQSKRKTGNSKHVKAKEQSHRAGKSQSKTDLTQGQQNTSSDGCKEGKQSDLGNRIRSTMKSQKSPVKEEPTSSSGTIKDKLTPTMVRERLCKSGKLAELQSRLAKIKECADQAKMQTKVATQEKATTGEKEKQKSSSMPAYQKYHSLASPAPPSLTLPFKYKTLEKMFHSMDTVVSLLHNRKETCTFPKLKDAVQEMCRKTFELRNVGQIKTVYPTSYFLSQQKHRTKQNKTSNQPENEYQLTVQPNLESDGSTSAAHDSSEVGSQAMRGATSSLMKKFTPSMLIARRTIFHNSLVDIVKQHHRTFLSKLERPLSVPDDKLTRWHPKFPLDTISEVEPSPLPEPPTVKTYSSAKDVLDKAREMMTPRVAKALETVAKNSAMLKSAKPKPSSSATLTKLAQDVKGQGSNEGSGLKGVNQSLLERIRAKEAQKQVEAMIRNPEVEQRITRLERLPELCRILRVYFLSEKKSALLYENIVKKLGDSCRSTLSRAEVEKHVDLMVEILPEWLTVHNIRKEKYIKMNKTKDINNVIDKVKKIWKESK